MDKDYKKLYKEALERAKYLKENTDSVGALDVSTCFEEIFPELRESDDERIRKELISFITDRKNWFPKEETKASWIAWLGKQGEQKPIEKVESKLKVGDTIKYVGEREEFSKEKHTIKKILDDCYLTVDDVYIPFKFEEYYIHINQNQPWSEEDEYQINTILHGLDLKRELYKKEGNKVEEERYNTQYNWLKSIKPNHRKPSEEQLRAIINSVQGLYQCKEKEVLLDLYEQLKNL